MGVNLKDEIIKLKREKNAVILSHFYQPKDVQEVADYVGDSYFLSKMGKECKENTIVFCGVKFMAESTKILSPNKKVIFPTPNATCPMANMITKEDVLRLKENHPNAKVVCYINSTAEVKSVVDVCCTSSNAIEIVKNLESDEIIFLPDKEFYILDMCCSNMKKNSIKEIYKCLKNHSNEIIIDENIREKAAKSLEKMHRLGV